MTEQTANVSTDVDNAHTVEVFLSALQNQDLDTAAAQLDDNLVYENVGFPTIRGRARAMKLFRGMQRPNLGFEVKIHRIAVNGASVLTERTDVTGHRAGTDAVLGVRRLRSSQRPNHVVAGLLRHVRHAQGRRSAARRRGGARTTPHAVISARLSSTGDD